VADAEARVHGGPDLDELRALGLEPERILDFSVNVNPYGPTPFMREAIRAAAIERYPDPSAAGARHALAGAWGVEPAGVVLGAGAAELLWVITRACVRAGDLVVIAAPTFSEARLAALAAGAEVVEVRARAEDGFRPERLADAIAARHPRLAYVCAPNNPTGQAWPVEELVALARRCPDTLLVVDQSFLSLSERHADAAVSVPDNVVRVRSLTKDHAIPGARVGAALATRALAATFEAARPAWSTGAVTQAAAIAAAAEQPFVAESRARLLADRAAMLEGVRALGLEPVPSSTVFVLVPVGDAEAWRAKLLRRDGILARDCASFGLPGYLRLAARPAADRARLLAALAAP
jgi:histidinol-phosphate/aromatic aminotransferase/cobyric acid decarboxylase-like protein